MLPRQSNLRDQLIFTGLFVLSLLFWFRIDYHLDAKEETYQRQDSSESDTSSNEFSHVIYPYRAFYDTRSGKGQIRILVLSKCLNAATVFLVEADGEIYHLDPIFLDGGKCGGGWTTGYIWHEYELASEEIESEPDEITLIVNATRSIKMEVHLKPEEIPGSLQVCVSPLYWYSDWPRLILFFEYWKQHNATYIIYPHSVTASVQRVFDYYVDQGVLLLVPWPKFPVYKNEDPNIDTYRLAHTLTQNDCVSRMSAEVGVLCDIDEYIYPTHNESVYDFTMEKLKTHEDMGSLKFAHRALTTPLITETFDAVLHSRILNKKGPPKVAFLPSRVRLLTTHGVSSHFDNYRAINVAASEALMLHVRNTFETLTVDDKNDMGEFSFYNKELQQRAVEIAEEIFEGDVPHFDPTEVLTAVRACVNRQRKRGPASPIRPDLCDDQVLPFEDWVLSEPNEEATFDIV